ncbi:hypothetical protein [Chitinophaga sp.]
MQPDDTILQTRNKANASMESRMQITVTPMVNDIRNEADKALELLQK